MRRQGQALVPPFLHQPPVNSVLYTDILYFYILVRQILKIEVAHGLLTTGTALDHFIAVQCHEDENLARKVAMRYNIVT